MATLDRRIVLDDVISFPVNNLSVVLRDVKLSTGTDHFRATPLKNIKGFLKTWKDVDDLIFHLIRVKLRVKDEDMMRRMLSLMNVDDDGRPSVKLFTNPEDEIPDGVALSSCTVVCKSINVSGNKVRALWELALPETEAVADVMASDDESISGDNEPVVNEDPPAPDVEDINDIKGGLHSELLKELEGLDKLKSNIVRLRSTVLQMTDMLSDSVDVKAIDAIHGCLMEYHDAKTHLLHN